MEKAERIQKIMANQGITSRRKAEIMIANGEVMINNKIATLGQKAVLGQDKIVVGETTLKLKNIKRLVYAFYKPKNCVSTLEDPQGRLTIKDLLPPVKERLYPVGRLDYDAEGLIFLTNDGNFAQKVSHPKHKLTKIYLVKLKGVLSNDDILAIKNGLTGKKEKFLPTTVRTIHTVNDKSWVEIPLREGKNNQLKKMFFILGHNVLKIKRIKIGNISVENLATGHYRPIAKWEIDKLLEITKGN